MHTRALRGLLIAAAAGSFLLGTTVPTQASEVAHPAVVSETAVTWTPHLAVADGVRPVAYSITKAGSTMVVGGRFHAVQNSNRSTTLPRRHVFAFDASTGVISPDFAPTFDDQVWSVYGDGNNVYVGGEFRTVNGVSRPALAKLNVNTGQLDPNFAPTFTGGRVTDIQMSNGRLIVGGSFKSKLVALNPITGKPTSYIDIALPTALPNTPKSEVFRFDVSPDGQHLVAVGSFTSVVDNHSATTQNNWRVFMMDLGDTQANVSPWRYAPAELSCHAQHIAFYQMYVRDVDFAPDSSYFVLASTGGFPNDYSYRFQNLCDSVVRFEVDELSPAQPYWMNRTGGDTLHSVIATEAAVYVQGHSRWLDNPYGQDYPGPGAVDRMGGGAVDSETGVALPWNPNMPQQKGGYQMLATSEGLWFATDGMRFNGKFHRGIRFAPLP